MGRNARRNDPPVRRVRRIELSEENMGLRLVGVVVALTVAVVAFGYVLNLILTPQTGWREIEVTNSKTGAGTLFEYRYHIGAGTMSASDEYRQASLIYTRSIDEAYRALDTHDTEGVLNLYQLNSAPNREVVVDPILYRALESAKAADCRYPFLAPVLEQYDSLYSSSDDSAAQLFDPAYSPEAAEFTARIAAFATDPDAVDVILSGNDRVTLKVSPEYLAYAAENEIENYVSFGWLRNAFILDHAAAELEASGLPNGVLSCSDGFQRVSAPEAFGLNLYDESGDLILQTGLVEYTGPMHLVSLRAYPILQQELVRYYTYADGSVRASYAGDDGMLHCAAPDLTVMCRDLTTAQLAMKVLPVYTAQTLDTEALTGLNWVTTRDAVIYSSGPDITVTVQRSGYTGNSAS